MTPPNRKQRLRRAEQDAPSFEESLGELEAAVHALEDGDLPLSESLERYEQGVKHLKQCYAQLEIAEQRIALLRGVNEAGVVESVPFVDEPTANLEEKAAKRGQRRTARTDQGGGQSRGGTRSKTTRKSSADGDTVDGTPGLF